MSLCCSLVKTDCTRKLDVTTQWFSRNNAADLPNSLALALPLLCTAQHQQERAGSLKCLSPPSFDSQIDTADTRLAGLSSFGCIPPQNEDWRPLPRREFISSGIGL